MDRATLHNRIEQDPSADPRAAVHQIVGALARANELLEVELLSAQDAKQLLAAYTRAENLAAYGKTVLSRKMADATEVARLTGTSVGKAKATVDTGRVLADSDHLDEAFRSGKVGLDQATEIAGAEGSAPGAAKDLVEIAQKEAFHVLKDKARKAKLEAERHRGLAQRQKEARGARSYSDELGMVHVHLAWEPHIGVPIVRRAEAEAQRLFRAAKKAGRAEPFERHLADAFAEMFDGKGKGRAKRPDVVVLVSYEVAKRGWTDVRPGEHCEIPGVGPVAPEVAREIAQDAFLNGVFFDGTDLRHFKRWTKHIPVEIMVALELGKPPEFDGPRCEDCGNRLNTQIDHVEPRSAGGPTSHGNLEPRCYYCHPIKTAADRAAGKLKPRPRSPDRPPGGRDPGKQPAEDTRRKRKRRPPVPSR